MTIMETKTIYVELKDEGTTCWRPVNALKLKDHKYKIVSKNLDPEDEIWEYNAGDIVVYEKRAFSDGNQGLVAVKKYE